MEASVRWCDWDNQGLEHCVLRQDAAGLSLEGVVAGTREGRYGACYAVQTDGHFRTREVRLHYIGGPALHVRADGRGHWRDAMNDAPIPELDGCLDVDIGATPATNTLPIKRLDLQEGESRNVLAAYVPLPGQIDGAFLPCRAEQRYTCLVAARRYRYEGLFRGFAAELDIDANGLVIDYPQTFRRL